MPSTCQGRNANQERLTSHAQLSMSHQSLIPWTISPSVLTLNTPNHSPQLIPISGRSQDRGTATWYACNSALADKDDVSLVHVHHAIAARGTSGQASGSRSVQGPTRPYPAPDTKTLGVQTNTITTRDM
ncbi:hypothetical protein M8818_003114 [Zalaria obscura]|uniref:Uncharacterized protein n=1 Tax=Zalaria obscura TaxID=2024903 RepID=A0ACC3SF37_9PEZI